MRNRSTATRRSLLSLLAPASSAVDFFDGRFQVHGYTEIQLRALASNYDPENADLSQWANVLGIEVDADLAPNGIGPFDTISLFGRALVRYDCIYTGCGMLPTWRYYGDRANRVPRNLATGRENPVRTAARARRPLRTLPARERADHGLR